MTDQTKHLTPYNRLKMMLKADQKDIFVLVVYTILSGLLTLAVPLAAQALVNTIAAGVLLQPLVVLSSLLFLGLLFAGTIKTFQFYLVEIIQQRVFVRVAVQFAHLIPMIGQRVLLNEYPPELVNRFFDVVKLQKSLAKLLLDGPAALLQILVGLTVMAIYSPLLLGFDIIFMLALAFIIFVLGRGGVTTSIEESEQKYAVAGWLEDVARCQTSLKMDASPIFAIKRVDEKVEDYLAARQSHFAVLFKQMIGHYFFYAVANAGILSIGGWLVIHRQLTLGQLVASELIIILVLAAMDKLVILLQDWFDLLTSIEKIGHLLDLPVEPHGGQPLPESTQGVGVSCRQVAFSYDPGQLILQDVSFSIESGSRVSLVSPSSSGKSTISSLISGLLQPLSGTVELDGIDTREIDLESLRNAVALVTDDNGIFEGTLEENIVVGRANLNLDDIKQVLALTQLADEVETMPEGLKTRLISAGRNLSRSQIQRIMIARAIVDRPRLIILDGAFTGIEDSLRRCIFDTLCTPDKPWTVLVITNDLAIIQKTQQVLVLDNGSIIETGEPNVLISNPKSKINQIYATETGGAS